MPTRRPTTVDPFLQNIAPDELHELPTNETGTTCANPKCRYPVDFSKTNDGWYNCPNCGYEANYEPQENQPTFLRNEDDGTKPYSLNPGGVTRAVTLTVKDLGDIGEQVVIRMGDLPEIGTITATSETYNNPIDCVVTGQEGSFGCEVKTLHSQSQERFKMGGKEERASKIAYCYTHGLKPALIGVRLNFYTDKAYVFFREAMTDSWIGNPSLKHVATVDFSDLNPFKSPNPQAQALAVEQAHLPDEGDVEQSHWLDDKPQEAAWVAA